MTGPKFSSRYTLLPNNDSSQANKILHASPVLRNIIIPNLTSSARLTIQVANFPTHHSTDARTPLEFFSHPAGVNTTEKTCRRARMSRAGKPGIPNWPIIMSRLRLALAVANSITFYACLLWVYMPRRLCTYTTLRVRALESKLWEKIWRYGWILKGIGRVCTELVMHNLKNNWGPLESDYQSIVTFESEMGIRLINFKVDNNDVNFASSTSAPCIMAKASDYSLSVSTEIKITNNIVLRTLVLMVQPQLFMNENWLDSMKCICPS